MHRVNFIRITLAELFGRLRDRVRAGAGNPPLPMLDEVLEEAARLRPTWGPGLAKLRAAGVPLNAKDDEEEEDDDDKPLSKKEADKLRKAIAKKDRELRDATKEQGKMETRISDLEEKLEEATDSGGDKDADKATERRIEKLEERVEKAEAKTEEETEKREAAEQTATAIKVATRLNFRNPDRAVKQLDSDDLTDEDSIESALEQLASEEPYMVASKKQRTVSDQKPKSKKSKSKDKDDDDEKRKSKSDDDDEPTGVERLRKAYEESEGDGEGDEGDEGESD